MKLMWEIFSWLDYTPHHKPNEENIEEPHYLFEIPWGLVFIFAIFPFPFITLIPLLILHWVNIL